MKDVPGLRHGELQHTFLESFNRLPSGPRIGITYDVPSDIAPHNNNLAALLSPDARGVAHAVKRDGFGAIQR